MMLICFFETDKRRNCGIKKIVWEVMHEKLVEQYAMNSDFLTGNGV